MSTWKFSCETKDSIPLPPEYTFPQAFNYLNPECNSFYILEAPNGSYLQCGGSKERCTVEWRSFHGKKYDHFVLGKRDGPEAETKIEMSDGGVTVLEREVFRHWEAIDLFKRFFSGAEFPDDIVLRKVNL
ncbi:hypothetical protein Pla175_04870 [Pirellulimonas nuda]|uniref:Uncharacterized protein n=1 Tax=Pirellulimonas nuda TaxID=2528009 RepID=A0A518D6P9_9BACT|nr:hypothetical protein [Pirellulimonas nuda]QDU87131.1 hypothetical protein Pla175_04870 [Pirellulimonas nuda]